MSHDYLVSYEGFCDPYTESCYMYCENDSCEEPFYSTFVERKASTLVELCGDSIIGCSDADACLPNEPMCNVSHCDPDVDDNCEELTQRDVPSEPSSVNDT